MYTLFNKFLSQYNCTQIGEKIFENFDDIKISVGTIYKVLKNNDFKWISTSIIPKEV